jgi:lipid A 3-O-deacylase
MIRTMRLGLALFTGLALTATQACAGDVYEIKAGVLAHDVPALWSGFRLEKPAADLNFEVMFNHAAAFAGGAVRPVVGVTANPRGDTSHAYAGLRWQYETSSGLFFGLGLGAAVHDGHLSPDSPYRKALGARVLFHIPAEIGYRLDAHNSVSAYFEHTSNGYTKDYNEALYRLGIRYGYRF